MRVLELIGNINEKVSKQFNSIIKEFHLVEFYWGLEGTLLVSGGFHFKHNYKITIHCSI